MAKKIKKTTINKKTMVIGIVAIAIVLVVLTLLLNPSLTGKAISCGLGTTVFSVHVDGNKEGYIAGINSATVRLTPNDRACTYTATTNENGDANIRLEPGKYRISISKIGKCSPHSEDIIITSSGLWNFRLQNCKRLFYV
ncbi:hypothetical protein J4409_02145 [Candidatus Woesearchaeota archaeon]|nr:hypothetical protein [Candidatus Woesearchaeota archaeon]